MIDLTGYRLTFDDEFNARSISQNGSGTTWADIRSQWRFDSNSDIGFGHSSFVDSSSGYDPFKVQNGALIITAVPDKTPSGYPGSWESGLITTQGNFSQTYGYFEMRADLSASIGAWDAFWLLPNQAASNPNHLPGWQELDIVEHYGANEGGVYSAIHTTDSILSQNLQYYSDHPGLTSGYHTYGMNWQPDRISFYFDGQYMGYQLTPTDMHGPMYILANLATQGSESNNADTAGTPMSMSIDYIRAYSNASSATAVQLGTISSPDGIDTGKLYGATAAVALTPSIPVSTTASLTTISLPIALTDASFDFSRGHTAIKFADGTIMDLTDATKISFSDGIIQKNDGLPLVDDLYYAANNFDVWRTHTDLDAHYLQYGWHEGRDPNAFFSTSGYLAANADVRSAGTNPLTDYGINGWHQGRDPSARFDNELYLAHNPDVRAAGIDPLTHYLQYGQAEGRQAYAAVGRAADLAMHPGFDAEYYLLANADVARAAIAAGGDSFAFAYNHYEVNGWHEGRNPNAVFDVTGYLTAYADVRASGMDPIAHYETYGWKEGRDPSAIFDTRAYEAHYKDVAAAHIDPMLHYLQYGAVEGRGAFSDGHFG
ncbi:glycoside hydrolase family 16 protein [Methylobacterium sp. WL119]|uniref:glycoside hydrolase family 16 protein n=1 Tax=unclassified Methylobacterium TaxID=2615210 RepID=UPI0011C974E3|nr:MULTISPECIES: glycoside hydrolase family 16 protein [unclassified Methylobacterium]TXN25574.1 glycoside hydrolase family 16 protein [Methylobacterium sp. WL93]TXN43528.1 glycoside hydrolase family 16 protein [Methylobacterium sp. WL119]